jgi:hypothetical protein
LWRSIHFVSRSASSAERALSEVVRAAASARGVRLTVKVASWLGSTTTFRIGAGPCPLRSARSVYEPAGSDGRKKRPALSLSVTRPAPRDPPRKSEITAPETGAP